MRYASSYLDCVDHDYERDVARADAVQHRVVVQMEMDADAICAALDEDSFDNAELAEAICENDAIRAMKYLREMVAERLTKRAERDYDEHNGRRR